MSAAVAWVRRRTILDWVFLGMGLAVFGYVGWDGALWDARFQLGLHLIAIGAIARLTNARRRLLNAIAMRRATNLSERARKKAMRSIAS